ncbi:MAG TPA: hypothetical protein VI072_32330 [Polyangiaceae bacterium]
MTRLLGCLVVALLAGCTHSVHQVSVSAHDIPRGAPVRRIVAEAEQHVVLYVTDNTDFVDEAHRNLLSQCPRGELVAVETRYSTSHGFLSFDNKVRMTGWCHDAQSR